MFVKIITDIMDREDEIIVVLINLSVVIHENDSKTEVYRVFSAAKAAQEMLMSVRQSVCLSVDKSF